MVSNFFSTLLTCKVLDDGEKDVKDREIPQWTKGNFQYNWIGIFILAFPIVGTLCGIFFHAQWTLGTFGMMLLWAVLNAMVGVTAGYHRLFSHRSYTAYPFMQYLTAFMGAGAFQGSIKWWARNHRVHHRYVDTFKDPYNAKRGFIFTHFGWFVMRMDYSLLGSVDTSDLDQNRVVIHQRKYFGLYAVLFGILLPFVTSYMVTGNASGSFFWCVFLKSFIVHQGTFSINSLVHTSWAFGTRPYAETITPHDCGLFGLITLGEGYHNFHHEFPQDYRNGHLWWQLDATKWYIGFCYHTGYCTDLIRTPSDVIARSKLLTKRRECLREIEDLDDKLVALAEPVKEVYTMEQVRKLVQNDKRKLIVVGDYVLDMDKPVKVHGSPTHAEEYITWFQRHPGGQKLLEQYLGKDATDILLGEGNLHTEGARALLPDLYVARLKGKAI